MGPTISTKDSKDYHGLYNEGATCYLNSVLQVFFMTKDFREAVERFGNTKEKYIDFKLKRLFATLKVKESNTKDVLSILCIKNVHEQLDAAEYFEKILTMVNPEVSKIFRGVLRYSTTCVNKHITSIETCPFWTMPLPVTDPLDSSNTYRVKDGFKEFFKSSTVSGENQIYCDECNKKADATIECRMEGHPDILTLLLKRFEFDYDRMAYVKINRDVEVPKTLQTENCGYELYAVVDHVGSLTGGHYTATIKSYQDDNWYVFDDSYVRQLNSHPSSALTERSQSAYLLVYRKLHVKNDHATDQVHIPRSEGGVNKEHGEHVEITTSGHDNGGEVTGKAVNDETKPIESSLMEERVEDTAHRQQDVDEDRDDVVLTKPDVTQQQALKTQQKFPANSFPAICPLWNSDKIVEKREQDNVAVDRMRNAVDNVAQNGVPNEVVEKGERDNAGKIEKDIESKGEMDLNESQTSPTKYEQSSRSTNMCESPISRMFHEPYMCYKFRGKAFQRGSEKQYSRKKGRRIRGYLRSRRRGTER